MSIEELTADEDRSNGSASTTIVSTETPKDGETAAAESVEGKDEPVEELPLDTVFEMLRNERRRRVLQYLNENGGETTLSDLAEHIAALENDTTVQALSSQERKRVYVGLYQCHLPKMDGADVIDFDSDRGDVERAAPADQIDPFLDVATEDEDATVVPAHYATAVGAGGLSYLAAAAVGTPTWLLGLVTVALVLTVAAVAVVALYRTD